ncbi:Helicase associated domain protein [Streptomyces sp. NPDC021093]|uniref:DEAD/DEAH box helicase n=1 Tax=Streptomyces sp. NPDC021093 TaxID=3365112 RepID=UPI00378CA058
MQKLMPHQATGVEAVVRALEAPAGTVPDGGLRAQVRMACGTGKTRLAAEVANRVAGGGRVLVVEPTLELVRQNLVAFRRDGGRRGAMAAVCSLGAGDQALVQYDVPSTMSPAQLAWWWQQLEKQGHRTWTVFTTYASIPTIVDAHALDLPGIRPLPAWDLIITDEAHRSAGTTSWSLVNEQTALPAVRRLALTATPRIWSTLPHGGGATTDLSWPDDEGVAAGSESVEAVAVEAGRAQLEVPVRGVRVPVVGVERPLASMDNPAWFGPVAYELSLQAAQAAGLAARFQIVVAEINDPVLQEAVALEGRTSERVRGLYLAAQQTAVLKAARKYRLKRVLAYANRVQDAEAFASGLAAQAVRLREAGVAVPRRVAGAVLSAKDPVSRRHLVLREMLVQGLDERGRAVDCAVVASVRLLSEGVDVPAVDAVAFIDPRGGAVDLVQCVGRALRIPAGQRARAEQGGGEGGVGPGAGLPEKVATIVVPVVHLGPGSGTDLYGPAWEPVVALLRALRSHSETLIDQLTSPRKPHTLLDAEDAAEEERVGVLRFLLGERDAGEIAQWVKLKVREGLQGDASRALAAAHRFHQRSGHLRVPRDYREGEVLLGVQVESWRKAYRAGELAGALTRELEGLGIQWAPRIDAWNTAWDAIGAYAVRQGHLLPRREETIEVEGRNRGIGRIMTDCRRPAFAVRWPGRVAALDGLGVPWRVIGPWDAAWQRHLELIDRYLREGGTVGELLGGSRRYGGEDLGKWVTGQHHRWYQLKPEQRQGLVERGLGRAPATAPGTGAEKDSAGHGAPGELLAVVRRRSRSERFQLLVRAAEHHRDQIGPLVDERGRHIVDPAYTVSVDGVMVRLRQRLHTARQRRSDLNEERLQQLSALGLPWADDEMDLRHAS